MAITSQDCILLLTELQDEGIDCKKELKEIMKTNDVSFDVLKFINDNRPLDVTLFYEKLRKSYNNKKSKLYINIVKGNFEEPKDMLITLASLNLQILLYNKNVEDSNLFLKHCRFDEIVQCMNYYAKTYDLIPCKKLLDLIKTDLKVLESINGRKVDFNK